MQAKIICKLQNSILKKEILVFAILMTVIFGMYGIGKLIIAESQRTEFLKTIDVAPVIDEHGTGKTYKLEFDLMCDKQGEVLVYMQNGSTRKYYFEEYIFAETSYQHYTLFVEPYLVDENENESFIAFYGEYGTGVKPRVKNITFALQE